MLDCRVMSLGEKRNEARFTIARREAEARNRRFRAPHHSANLPGMLSELCLAAGGVLYLDSAHEMPRTHLRTILRTAAAMEASCRPVVIITCSEEMVRQVRDLIAESRANPLVNASIPCFS